MGVCIAQFDSHSTHTDREWALGAAAGFSRASTCWTYVEFRHVALRHMALEFVSFHVFLSVEQRLRYGEMVGIARLDNVEI